MTTLKPLQAILTEKFGPAGPIVTAVAPGRVNLLGEHTDYNEGYVLPMAIEFQMRMAGRLRADATVNVHSVDFQQTVVFSVAEPLLRDEEHPWSNYIRGVLWAFQDAGYALPGLDLAFRGDLPQGAGLSSSAALEISLAVLLQKLAGWSLAPAQVALLCQRAENEFVGMKCGVMDQFASIMGQAGHALFLDCRTLAFEHIPLEVGDYRILICHSGVKHELVTSEYNLRRASCNEGVAMLQRHFPEVKALRDVTLEMLETYHLELDPTVFRRCFHIVTENRRVLEGIQTLRRGDLERFGQLMNQSHDSQRDYYEVSCAEVDLLVALARQVPGVLGARITGGGFGGCTVNLIHRDAIERFRQTVVNGYHQKTGIEPRLFVCAPGPGARIVE